MKYEFDAEMLNDLEELYVGMRNDLNKLVHILEVQINQIRKFTNYLEVLQNVENDKDSIK